MHPPIYLGATLSAIAENHQFDGFQYLADPREEHTRPRQGGIGATWIGRDPKTGSRRLVACYSQQYGDDRLDDLARLLGLTLLRQGVAHNPFGSECHLVDGAIVIVGFGVPCLRFRTLDEPSRRVLRQNPHVLLLMSNGPIEDINPHSCNPTLDHLWAAEVRVTSIEPAR